ncbi:hypothetical protein DPEC_G00297610 [Dallia pectoralis]|uniref:Uncharacterized protein n=1 Tax=Dallia pectoralis TaxID=75939 RepID=A0ACC2FFT5_DALPE|nr:hypothetical protein DPEC_G00297610 [Dallia pectoralis]
MLPAPSPAQEPALTGSFSHSPGTSTMQSVEDRLNRGCLLLALKRYRAAVRDMEQTILLPSLLMGVESNPEEEDCFQGRLSAASGPCEDLHDSYLKLKSIQNTVECGLMPSDEPSSQNQTHLALNDTLEALLEGDPEALVQFHLRGLFSIMANLTKKSQGITNKYMDIIGVMN